MTDTWAFYALGTPAPQGSKKMLGRTGGPRQLVESSAKVKPWRDTVTAAGYGAGPLLDGPIAVAMVFTVPRPKSAKRTEAIPYRAPDLSKLARSTEDAITAAGLWADDARVSEYARLAKVWPDYDDESLPVPGVVVAATAITSADLDGSAGRRLGHAMAGQVWQARYKHNPDNPWGVRDLNRDVAVR